jgi:hypothetical protein
MIGKFQLQLGADQFISGMSSSDYATDGALGNTSNGLNPFVQPGVIKSNYLASSGVANLVDNIIATSEDATSGLQARLMVGDAANYYTMDTSGNMTKVYTGSDTTHYNFGRTDIAIQSNNGGNGMAFVSHGTDIAAWNGSTTVTENWWTTIAYYTGTSHPLALGSTPHPMITYNTNLWIADGAHLHNITPNAALIATPSVCVNQYVFNLELYSTIYALGIDPMTGLMMISYQDVSNQGDTISSQFFVGLYDGYSTGLRRKIPVDDLVTAFQNVGGTVYVTYGNKVGYWNGNGITFLRRLMNVANGTTTLLYKHRVASVSNVLLVADGQTLLGYGEPVGGKPKAWFNIGNSNGNVDKITAVCPLGNNVIGLFNYATYASIFYATRYDLSSTSGSNFALAFNNIYFPRPVFIRRMRVITTGIAHTGYTDITISILNEKGAVLPISTANRVISVPTGTTYVLDFDFSQAKCIAIQPIITATNGAWGLVRVIIYYDVAE